MCLRPPKINTPEQAPVEQTLEERKGRINADEARRRRLASSGLQSTILTGPSASSGAGKTKMGQ